MGLGFNVRDNDRVKVLIGVTDRVRVRFGFWGFFNFWFKIYGLMFNVWVFVFCDWGFELMV